jgi:Uma2 family endonuclease
VDYPEIVLEVIHTAPLLNKLDVYAGMGVAEVWIFKDAAFALFALDWATKQYVAIERSRLVPALDFALLARYVVREDTPQALREFAATLRS